MLEWISTNEEDTMRYGAELARQMGGGGVIAMFGGLGMGKTAFVRGMAQVLSPHAQVTSPTFSLVNAYGGNPPLYHFDMYRVHSWEDLETTGFFEYIDAGAVLAVEWSENIENALPKGCFLVCFERLDEETRRITVCRNGDETQA